MGNCTLLFSSENEDIKIMAHHTFYPFIVASNTLPQYNLVPLITYVIAAIIVPAPPLQMNERKTRLVSDKRNT